MPKEREFLCQCPKCLTFETVWLNGGKLMPTKRFKQDWDGKIYHDCSSKLPCRLYPRFIESRTF